MLMLFFGCVSPDSPGASGDAPVEALPDAPDVFDDSVIHTIAISVDDTAIRSLDAAPYEYVEGGVTIDGLSVASVGVRLRGKYGSFRDLDGKPKFKIDFNRYVEGQRFAGYETLALNNTVVDCSYLREATGYAVFREVGLAAPRTAFATVAVNGEYYGLYVMVEFPDDTFLADHYADGTGNLYDGKYLYWDEGDSYALVDFTSDLVGNFQLEEGTDVGGADVQALAAAAAGEGTFADRMGPLLDLDQYHLYAAVEQWIGQLDGYVMNRNNYRVYFDPEDGRAELLPYDLDYAFYHDSEWRMNWGNPAGALAVACDADDACMEAQAAAAVEVAERVDTTELLERYDAWAELVYETAQDDPRRECRRAQIDDWQEELRDWVEDGSLDLVRYWD